ncbi:MAG TPA: hypothetical protein VHC22_02515 [Pirellulales bacterium]|nr:hypothetical protein [Pirellulales bacterium]
MRRRPAQRKSALIRALHGGLISAAGLAFLVAAVGVPLPAARTKDRSIAFPCMDRPCGCHDAAACKAHCCCFSSEEKLAWASAHDVDPTPFVDDRALASLIATDDSPFAGKCCESRRTAIRGHADSASCCAKKVDPRQPTARCNARTTADRSARVGQHAHKSPNSDVLSIAAYRECTGLQPLWTLLNAALPPPAPVGYEFDWFVSGRVVQTTYDIAVVSFSPATPPPRA